MYSLRIDVLFWIQIVTNNLMFYEHQAMVLMAIKKHVNFSLTTVDWKEINFRVSINSELMIVVFQFERN